MSLLDDMAAIEKIDRGGMRDVLAGLPQQMQEAFQLGRDFPFPPDFAQAKNIVFSGMGGSAIGAEIIAGYLKNEMKVVVSVNRDYGLPAFVDRESLVILLSYSGNTEETLSAYTQACKRGAQVITLSSGGALSDFAGKGGHPHLLIPAGLPPRGALAYLSIPFLAIFSQMKLIAHKEEEVREAAAFLARMQRDSLGMAVPKENNPAKRLALQLRDSFCLIYAAGEHLSGVVSRWRGQFAENSKMLSSGHIFPEMNHNEIEGFRHPEEILKRCVLIFLRDAAEHPQVKKRMEISKEILQKERLRVEEIWSGGMNLLARIFSLIYVGDYTSFYLAILNGEDPLPVQRIDYLKQRLKEV